MPYVIKTCPTCGTKYHVHLNQKGKIKKITGACEHVRTSRISRSTVHTVDIDELDKMIDEEYKKSEKEK